MIDKSTTEEHPCFGHISVSRFSGNNSRFFASDVKHHGGISLTICAATIERSLSHDWIHPTKHIIEVQMSALQFAELITTGMNSGGTPCTIKSRNGERVYLAEFKDGIDEHQKEYDATSQGSADEVAKALHLVDRMLAGKTVKKSDLKEVRSSLHTAHMHITSNLKYVSDCFGKHLKRAVIEAKTSVENFIETKIRTMGIKGLQEEARKTTLDIGDE